MKQTPFLFSLAIAHSLFVVDVYADTDSQTSNSQGDKNAVSIVSNISANAYTGVFNTPNTQVINWGDFEFNYSDNFTDTRGGFLEDGGFARAHDLKFGVGILPNVEVVGRLASRDLDCNGFEESGCGFRDLSGSLKWHLDFISNDYFDLTVGVQDLGGAANYSEAYYALASAEYSLNEWGAVRVNLGVSSSDNNFGYMDGVFSSVEYQVFEWIQIAAEHDANAFNAGFKFSTPSAYLPKDWQLYANAQLYSSDDEHNEHDAWFSAGVVVPLEQTASSQYQHSLNHSVGEEVVNVEVLGSKADEPLAARSKVAALQSNNGFDLLEQRLISEGFESVAIGLMNTDVVIRVENNIYNRNEFDAVASVRHIALMILGDIQGVIQITNAGIVSYIEPIRANSEVNQSLASAQYNSNVDWQVENIESAHFVPRLTLAPEVKSLVGTEYGTFDYDFALSSRLQMSVWSGGVIEVRHLSDTISNSDDFEDGEYIQGKYGLTDGIDTRLFHQSFALPYNFFTQFSYGRIEDNVDGLLNETRWADNSNTHRFNLLYGDYESEINAWGGKRNVDHAPKLIKYRYRYLPLNWDLELTAGEYWHGDKGFTFRSLHWFGNVQVGLRYSRTKFDDVDGGEEEDFVALGFSIPLNFSKSMKSDLGFQIKGSEQWDYYVQTNLESEGTANTIKTGFAKEPRLYHNLNQAYFNRDRF
ncbi:YjbH domain-containing protein [Thalassomonas sp. M1454]|uniref:YjbH domain-containing protein n=1 Tax=Thalassomonas sp. M1454 TaxID=2594477 RepID=UPI0011815174|nr:YjbH domain-containing protein [Thalassomonas sp. M1454]TRX57162.1 YjbH domain-containing protein [Thalassomonas sp. M1454]